MEPQLSPTPRRRLRLIGWTAVTSIVVLILLIGATAGASATVVADVTNLHQATPISSSNPAFQGSADECAGTAAGTVDWHFVLVQTSATSGMLQATFTTAGTQVVSSDKHAGGTLHFDVITTGADTLTGAFTDQAGKLLNLSHICVGPPVSTTSSSTSSTSSSTSSTSSSTSSTSSSTSSVSTP